MTEGAAAGGSSGPAVSQPVTSISEAGMRTAKRRIGTSGSSVSAVFGAPKMRLPLVHLQHIGSLK